MVVRELVGLLKNIPPDTKVFILGDLGWYELKPTDVKFIKAFKIWHSDYNANGTPYEDYQSEPSDIDYDRGRDDIPHYITKTIGTEFIVSLE